MKQNIKRKKVPEYFTILCRINILKKKYLHKIKKKLRKVIKKHFLSFIEKQSEKPLKKLF